MKQSLLFALSLSLVAAAAVAAPLADGDVNKALDEIKKTYSPSYMKFFHDKIVADTEAFLKTNELTYAQRATVARRIAEHAFVLNDEGKVFERYFGELNALTNVQVKTSNLRSLADAVTHTYSFDRTKGWGIAMRIFDENAALFDPVYRVSKRGELASLGISLFRDRAKARFDELFKLVLDEPCPEGDNRWAIKNFLDRQAGALCGMAKGLLPLGEDVACKQFEQYKDHFSEGVQISFLKDLAKYHKDQKNRKGFDEIFARIDALPADKRDEPYRSLLEMLKEFDSGTARTLVEAELKKPLSPTQRQNYLGLLQGFYSPPRSFTHGFTSGDYAKWREITRERLAVEDANKDVAGARYFTYPNWKVADIECMIWFDDLDMADVMLDRSLALWPKDRRFHTMRAQVQAIRGDVKAAAATLRGTLDLPDTKPDETNRVNRVIAFLEGKGLKGFDAVNKPLNLTSEARLGALRQTSARLFSYRRYDDCRALYDEITKKMYAPDLIRVHTATYMPDVPKSADGFVRTEMYNDWAKMETRFYPYGDTYGESWSVDVKRHLKDAVQPVCDERYPTGIRALYDDEGVHVFIRCDDPAIDEVKLGKRRAGELEMCFRPGDQEKPYHSIFFTGLPGTDNPHDCEWAMPGRHYRRNVDSFTKDAVLTPDGVVAHLSIPWIAFYDDLPVNGVEWVLGVIRTCPAGLTTIGGGVHELSRGMHIKFNFSKQQLIDLKRRISVTAFNRYKSIRGNDGRFIKMWNDPVLGDPDFYAAEVAPLLEELDRAGEELLAPCADKAVEKFFSEYTPLWAEIQYEIADRRTRYLNNRLFEE